MGRPAKVRGTCTVTGCGEVERSGGLCRRHYAMRWRRQHSTRVDADTSGWTADALAWAAGWLDSRGSFTCKERTTTKPYRGSTTEKVFRVRLSTYNEDVADRLADLLGIGVVAARPFRGKYSWTVNRQQHIRALCEAVRPWMSARRQGQIDALLAAMPVREVVPS
jgi:hypothetical protein